MGVGEIDVLVALFTKLLGGGMLLAVVLIYGLGFFIKNYTEVSNNYIPWINLVVGGIVGLVFLGFTANAFAVGLLIGISSVVLNAYVGRNLEKYLKLILTKLIEKKPS